MGMKEGSQEALKKRHSLKTLINSKKNEIQEFKSTQVKLKSENNEQIDQLETRILELKNKRINLLLEEATGLRKLQFELSVLKNDLEKRNRAHIEMNDSLNEEEFVSLLINKEKLSDDEKNQLLWHLKDLRKQDPAKFERVNKKFHDERSSIKKM